MSESVRSVSFAQWSAEQGIDDPFGDVLALGSPSGRMSKRATTATHADIAHRQSVYWQAQDRYQVEVNAGRIVDPTGRVKPRPPDDREHRLKLAAIQRRIDDFEHMCRCQPRSRKYRKALEIARTEMAVLTQKSSTEMG